MGETSDQTGPANWREPPDNIQREQGSYLRRPFDFQAWFFRNFKIMFLIKFHDYAEQ